MILEGCAAEPECLELHKGIRAADLIRILQSVPLDAIVLVNRVSNLLVLDHTAPEAYSTARVLGYVDLASDTYEAST